MKLQIEKMRRELFGAAFGTRGAVSTRWSCNSKNWRRRPARMISPPSAGRGRAGTTNVAAFTRQRPSRKPFPEHLPRERVVIEAPSSCPCCGGSRLSKLGEDVTETLEVVPRQWKVIQHVREKVLVPRLRKHQSGAGAFHVIPGGWAGPSLLAMIVFEKFGQHQPLNRQAERYAREGVPLSLSTLANQVGACASVLRPIFDLLEPMSSPPRGCMATTPPCPCSPRERPILGDVGSACATTAPSAAPRRQRRCSIIRAIEPAT